jgi:hypothetical protein
MSALGVELPKHRDLLPLFVHDIEIKGHKWATMEAHRYLVIAIIRWDWSVLTNHHRISERYSVRSYQ